MVYQFDEAFSCPRYRGAMAGRVGGDAGACALVFLASRVQQYYPRRRSSKDLLPYANIDDYNDVWQESEEVCCTFLSKQNNTSWTVGFMLKTYHESSSTTVVGKVEYYRGDRLNIVHKCSKYKVI